VGTLRIGFGVAVAVFVVMVTVASAITAPSSSTTRPVRLSSVGVGDGWAAYSGIVVDGTAGMGFVDVEQATSTRGRASN
jgi:hypothetical protein